jgi:hypothetical protein
MSTMTAREFTRPVSETGLFVASAVWAAAIIIAAIISTSLLSIPGAAGASFFWLPMIFMVTAAIWFGWRGWVAAAVGTFLGGALAGNPLAINIGQNPLPAFFANTLLLWLLFRGLRIAIPSKGASLSSRTLGTVVLIVVGTIVFSMIVGFLTAPVLGRWGYLATLVATLPAWVAFRRMGIGAEVDANLMKAVLAIVITSFLSAAMGAYAWATVGQMGAAAYSIVLPGWFLGDVVAGILGLAVLWGLTGEMRRRGLSVY